MTLIVDAAPLVALGDARDPRHGIVREVLEAEGGQLILPAPVATEVDYLLRRRGGPVAERNFLEDLARGRFRVEGLTPEEHVTALALHDRYADLDLGLADLSVVVLARRFNANRILTFDERHFRSVKPLYGDAFVLLPADAV